jgi:hypothetical protein
MTKANVLNPIIHIQNSNIVMVMAHFAMVEWLKAHTCPSSSIT